MSATMAANEAPTVDVRDRQAAHREALLSDRRCPSCAERLAPIVLLRGEDCPRCASPLHDGDRAAFTERTIGELQGAMARWRWAAYGASILGFLLTSFLPGANAVATLFALAAVRIFVVRRPLRWLSPLRRTSTRLLLNLVAASLAAGSVGLNVIAAFAGLFSLGTSTVGSVPVLTVYSGLATVAYVELSLRFVVNRMRREAAGPGLDPWEWLLPLGVFSFVVGVAVTTTLVLSGSILVMNHIVWPGAAAITRFFLDLLGG